ncbi:hypothetical protein ABZ820_39820 [Streptomyces diacarni]|uniref:hypothetical protein n=1 Tax=Streptomyces diacarni TaxID=2800381 RepID=UPI0033E2974B
MDTLFRCLLDGQKLKDYEAFLPRFRQAVRELAEAEENPRLVGLEPAPKTFEAWYYGRTKPQRDSRRVLIRWFGYTIEQLWGPAPAADEPLPPPTLFPTAATDDRAASGTVLDDMRRTAHMAAQRAADFAMGAERGQIGEVTLGLLTDKVRSIIEEYPRVSLSTIWEDIAETQDRVFRLLEGGRAHPAQLRDLHFLAAVLAFHMAKGCHDMGDAKLAMTQARAAGVCAQQAEHDGLIALTYGLKSLITFWSGKGSEALHYSRQGAATTSTRGTAPIWLAGLEARAAALLGDEESVRCANQHGQALRDSSTPDDLDELGGLLTFSPTKQLYYNVEARVLLGHGSTDVITQAEEAVRGFSDTNSTDWAFGDQAGAQCILALTRLHSGEVDGAAEAVRPVLDLAPTLRNRGIIVSANRVGARLTKIAPGESAVARDLREEIEAYAPNRLALLR